MENRSDFMVSSLEKIFGCFVYSFLAVVRHRFVAQRKSGAEIEKATRIQVSILRK